jgi:hypothetical protein
VLPFAVPYRQRRLLAALQRDVDARAEQPGLRRAAADLLALMPVKAGEVLA